VSLQIYFTKNRTKLQVFGRFLKYISSPGQAMFWLLCLHNPASLGQGVIKAEGRGGKTKQQTPSIGLYNQAVGATQAISEPPFINNTGRPIPGEWPPKSGDYSPQRTGNCSAKKNNAKQFEGKFKAGMLKNGYAVVNVQMKHLFQFYYDRNGENVNYIKVQF
jgi:hypothetical protein